MANAQAAKAWFLANGGTDIERHFVATTTNVEAAAAFGITTTFGFWDWVGGRYSLWSAVGLPIALAIGAGHFRDAVVDERTFVVGQVGPQFLAVEQNPAHRRSEVLPIEVDRLAGQMGQRPQRLARLVGVAVPDQVAQPLDVDADVVEADLVRRPQGEDAGQRLLDVAHPHRNVPPVEDVVHWLARGGAHEVEQRRLAIADDGHRATWLPALGDEGRADGLRRLLGAQWPQGEAPR